MNSTSLAFDPDAWISVAGDVASIVSTIVSLFSIATRHGGQDGDVADFLGLSWQIVPDPAYQNQLLVYAPEIGSGIVASVSPRSPQMGQAETSWGSAKPGEFVKFWLQDVADGIITVNNMSGVGARRRVWSEQSGDTDLADVSFAFPVTPVGVNVPFIYTQNYTSYVNIDRNMDDDTFQVVYTADPYTNVWASIRIKNRQIAFNSTPIRVNGSNATFKLPAGLIDVADATVDSLEVHLEPVSSN